MSKMGKITFLGDIMCEEPLLRASRRGTGYDFEQVFSGCKNLFSGSDLVIGNLETVFAGSSAGYTNSLFSFNTPDQFADAMAHSGIGMVTTATNHALDRDKTGLIRTLDILDTLNVQHIGAYRSEDERNKAFIKQVGGRSVAFLNYTYGTNLNESPYVVGENDYYLLNLLMPQMRVKSKAKEGIKGQISKVVYKTIPMKHLLKLKKMIGREYVNRYQDVLDRSVLKGSYIRRLREDVAKAKESADLVVVCLHIGGQFNASPGEQVEYFTKLFSDLGVDYLINTHAHVVQATKRYGNTFVAHCLGNFSISPSSIYIPHELKPEYSIALHLNLTDEEANVSFSILKIVEKKDHTLRVVPVYDLACELNGNKLAELKKDILFIYNRFTGANRSELPVQSEYSMET